MESQDKEKEYERNIWEIYRKEWAPASREKRIELNKRMLRWQGLMKSGWAASQAYYKVMEEPQETPPIYPFWTKMRKAFVVIPVLALAAAIVYGIVITGEIDVLKTELESVQSVLTSTQAQFSSMEQTLASTQSELSSMEQRLTSTQAELRSIEQTLSSTQTELSSIEQTLSSTQTELSSTEQTLASTQTELSSTEQTLASTQTELSHVNNTLASVRNELEDAEAKLELYKETLGIDVFSGEQPLYEKGGLGTSREINLINNQIATNPTWQELRAFLRSDPTDDETYWEPVFNCTNFAEMLHNNAEAAGTRATFVAVFFEGEEEGHALNAFRTTDKGLVYVDCTGRDIRSFIFGDVEYDKIAYVVKGKEYGVISINRATSPEYSYYEQIGKSLSNWLPLGIVESIKIYW